MPEIVITEFVMDSTIDNLTQDYKVHYDRGLAERQDELPALLSDCKGLIVRNRTKIMAELLDAAPNFLAFEFALLTYVVVKPTILRRCLLWKISRSFLADGTS